jgi:hypothetical protein
MKAKRVLLIKIQATPDESEKSLIDKNTAKVVEIRLWPIKDLA